METARSVSTVEKAQTVSTVGLAAVRSFGMSAMLSPPGMSRPSSPAAGSLGQAKTVVARFRVMKKAVLKAGKDLE
eukprot:COSAG02_NODE_26224_length_638_cov_0.766234_1_plen_75_part_00